MTSFLKRALKNSIYLVFQTDFLCVAAVFAWHTKLLFILGARYFMSALAYAVDLYCQAKKLLCVIYTKAFLLNGFCFY